MGIFARVSLYKEVQKGNVKKVKTASEVRTASQNANLRDTNTTNLLIDIIRGYKSKMKINKIMKIILFSVSLLILVALILAFLYCLKIATKKDDIATILAILIPAGVTIITSVISIIMIIAKYLFPQDEDKNFANLIKVLTSQESKINSVEETEEKMKLEQNDTTHKVQQDKKVKKRKTDG